MKLEFRNLRGDVLPLTNAKNYKLTNFDGQTQAVSSISGIVVGGVDGDTANNIQTNPRPVIIDLRIEGNVEDTKREILSVIKSKQQGIIVWEQNERTLELRGIVEAIDMPRWNNEVIMQITLHCEQPYWENIDTIVYQINEAIALHYFTVDGDMLCFPTDGIALGEYDVTRSSVINNTGDVSVGLEIEIVAYGTVTNPIIYNQDGNFFGCGYGTGNKQVVMQAGDVIKIVTRKDEKDVTLNGVSILGKIKPRSTWLQLQAGDNQFSINSDDEDLENMSFSLNYKQRYV